MRITIDTDQQYLDVEGQRQPLYTRESFEMVSDLWLRMGWSLKYPYTFSWMGFPILQIPEDMIRMQEVIFRLKPDVIVETGIAHGGSLIYYASLCKLIGHGRVVGVEKGLRCEKEVLASDLAPYITMIEGDSTEPYIVERVKWLCSRGVGNNQDGKERQNARVLVILDSNHSRQHVYKELQAYADLVESGSYIVATDGNMCDLADVPRGHKEWAWDNPQEAVRDFISLRDDFVIDPPAWPFNESQLSKNVTYWPSAWLRRV